MSVSSCLLLLFAALLEILETLLVLLLASLLILCETVLALILGARLLLRAWLVLGNTHVCHSLTVILYI